MLQFDAFEKTLFGFVALGRVNRGMEHRDDTRQQETSADDDG
jgi:hypothetical protein